MANTLDFRLRLAQRIFALMAVSAASAAGFSASGCFTGTSCGNGDGTYDGTECFNWPEDAGTVSSGGGGMGGAGGSGGGMPVVCPSEADAKGHFVGVSVISVNGPGTVDNSIGTSRCCYPVTAQAICEGRPFLVEQRALMAELTKPQGTSSWEESDIVPELSGLSAEERSILAAMWTKAARMEHASIASFGRFALELLAAGAPSGLVEGAHRAALDEVRHAKLCFALASAYAGETLAPGVFELGGSVEVAADLADVAVRTWNEGCVGETLSACLAAEQLANAEDPAVRAVLSAVAEEEAAHAELSFRTVAWAIRVGGERVRAAVAQAAARTEAVAGEGAEVSQRLEAHGKLSRAKIQAAMDQAMRDVVRPAARMLLSARAADTGPSIGLNA